MSGCLTPGQDAAIRFSGNGYTYPWWEDKMVQLSEGNLSVFITKEKKVLKHKYI